MIKDLGVEADNKLPRIPKLTEKQLEINDAQQKEWERKPAHGSTYDRALAVIRESEAIPLKDMMPAQRANYAEALAGVGKFKEAARIAQDSEKKAYYRAIDKAIWCDDGDRCKCENHRTFDKDKNPVEYDRHFVVRKLWSEKHGKVMSLQRCNNCGFLNCR